MCSSIFHKPVVYEGFGFCFYGFAPLSLSSYWGGRGVARSYPQATLRRCTFVYRGEVAAKARVTKIATSGRHVKVFVC